MSMMAPRLKVVTDWIITAKCPLRCEHCIVGELVANAKSGSSQELTTQECKDLIDFLYANGSRILSITGGEALTRNDLFEVIEYGRNKGMKVFLYTTGLPMVSLKQGKLKLPFAHKVLSHVDFLGVSLDTFHNDAYQQLSPRDYCEVLVSELFDYASGAFSGLQIQLFTVLGRRNGVASVAETISDCSYVAGVISSVAKRNKVLIRWRLSPFRFNPGSMLPWQKKLLFSSSEIDMIQRALLRDFGDSQDFSMHFGVDYDSFFVYPDGKFRTVQLDEEGVDRFVELGNFRNREFHFPEVWQELYYRDGETAKKMKRNDILAVHAQEDDDYACSV